jgi:aspartate/methionine/tyrosine aminotransferase
MWLDMTGVRAVPLPCDEGLIPDPEAARRLITPRTRAIAIVSPNNPTGVEYPAETVRALYDLAKAADIALVLDETYRDFDARDGRPHDLFTDPDWADTLIHLYSFSKAFRLTGHRVGALITSEARMLEIEKFLDTVAICPAQLGQHAALFGLQNMMDWVAGERAEILARRRAMETAFAGLPDWRLRGIGAYFAYVAHPSDDDATPVAKRLALNANVLALPGTFFAPQGDPLGSGCLRIAFANIDVPGIAELARRLADHDA